MPAKLLTDAIGGDPRTTFAAVNAALVLVMLVCAVVFLSKQKFIASVAWFWVALELVNGVVHIVNAVVRDGYFPGLYTAPALIVFALATALYLVRTRRKPVNE